MSLIIDTLGTPCSSKGGASVWITSIDRSRNAFRKAWLRISFSSVPGGNVSSIFHVSRCGGQINDGVLVVVSYVNGTLGTGATPQKVEGVNIGGYIGWLKP